MSEYPTYHTHGRYVPPGSTKRSPYEEVKCVPLVGPATWARWGLLKGCSGNPRSSREVSSEGLARLAMEVEFWGSDLGRLQKKRVCTTSLPNKTWRSTCTTLCSLGCPEGRGGNAVPWKPHLWRALVKKKFPLECAEGVLRKALFPASGLSLQNLVNNYCGHLRPKGQCVGKETRMSFSRPTFLLLQISTHTHTHTYNPLGQKIKNKRKDRRGLQEG